MTQDEVFDRLVENAMDFFDRSTRELERNPKYALIHFCAAMELFVKARLLLEGWEQVPRKKDSLDWDKFCDGEYNSVNLDEAQARLKDVGDALDDAELAAFKAVVQHRNRLVHFYHKKQSDKAALRRQVLKEQVLAWSHLYRLLTRRWRDRFPKYQRQIQRMERMMLERAKYLSAKHDVFQQDIEDEMTQGVRFESCLSCGQHTSKVEPLLGELLLASCRVCNWEMNQLEIECFQCGGNIFLDDGGWGSCGCGCQIRPPDLIERFWDDDRRIRARKDGDDLFEPGNCAACGNVHVLIPFHEQYMCVACFELSNAIYQCRHCGEFTNVLVGASYLERCFVCRHEHNSELRQSF